MKTTRLITPFLINTFLALSLSSIALAQDGAPPPAGQGGQRPGGRGGQVDPAQMIERMMGMDANADGKLSRDEMPPMLVERIFDRADTNHDGFIERAEIEVFAKEGGPLRGAGQGGGQGAGRGGAAGGAPVNMEGAMKQANAALRALRGSALDASTQKTDLEAVQRLQMGLVGSKAGIASVPMSDAAKAKFGDDKAAYEREFRKTLLASIIMSFEVEQAILDGEGARAKATLEKLHSSEDSGHALFQKEGGYGGDAPSDGAAPAEGAAGGEGAAEGGERPRGRGGRANRPPATE